MPVGGQSPPGQVGAPWAEGGVGNGRLEVGFNRAGRDSSVPGGSRNSGGNMVSPVCLRRGCSDLYQRFH